MIQSWVLNINIVQNLYLYKLYTDRNTKNQLRNFPTLYFLEEIKFVENNTENHSIKTTKSSWVSLKEEKSKKIIQFYLLNNFGFYSIYVINHSSIISIFYFNFSSINTMTIFAFLLYFRSNRRIIFCKSNEKARLCDNVGSVTRQLWRENGWTTISSSTVWRSILGGWNFSCAG